MDARHAAGLAALALALAGCGSDEAKAPPRVAGPAGAPALIVQDDAELLFRGSRRAEQAIERLDRAGVRAVRVTAGWSQLAPAPRATVRPRFDAADPGAYRAEGWRPIDRAVRLARERGMAVMVDIGFWAPVWATAGDTSQRPRQGIDPREFAAFARAVARRYADDVGTFTLWNEPNHSGFFGPQRRGGRPASPHLYRRMVTAAYPAVKAEAPDATVLVGGLAAYGRRNGIPPLEFLRELACVDHRLRPIETGECATFKRLPGDGFAHHPFSTNTAPDKVERSASPDDVPLARIGKLVGLLERLASDGRIDPRLRNVYLTEYAYETNPPDPGVRYDPARAARSIAFAEALAAREPRVRSFAQFMVRDLPGTTGGPPAGDIPDWQSGLLFADGTPKPLATVLPAPLHVERVDSQFVRLWGRVRAGTGRRRVRVEARRDGPWRLVIDGRTDRRGIVEAEQPARRGTVFRIGRRERGVWVYGPIVDEL